MLQRVLQEVEAAEGSLRLVDLARRLEVEPGALEGMIDFWVRKGRLKNDVAEHEATQAVCSGGACGRSCPGPQGCPFILQLPQTYTLAVAPDDRTKD